MSRLKLQRTVPSRPPSKDRPADTSNPHIRKRLARSFSATGFGLGVTLLIQLLSVPIFLHSFGITLYGEWLVLTAIPAYLNLSDLGFTGIAGNEMTMRVAMHDQRGAQAAFQTAWVMVTGLSALVAGILLAFVWLFNPERLLPLSMMNYSQVALTCTFLLGYTLLSLQAGILESGFRCVGFFPRGNLGLELMRLLAFGAAVTAVLTGAGPVGAAAAQLIAGLTGFGFLRLRLRHDVPWLRFGRSRYSSRLARQLAPPALALLCFPVGTALAVQGMTLVVSVELGAAAVVVLSTVRTVATSIRQLVNVINYAVWPELSRVIAAKQLHLARRVHVLALRASLLITLFAGGILFFAGSSLIHLWTGGRIVPPATFFTLMLVTVGLDSVWLTSSVTLMSVNRHQRIAVLFAVSSVIAILAAAVLLPILGLSAVPLALMASDVVLTGYVIRASTALLSHPRWQFGRDLAAITDWRL